MIFSLTVGLDRHTRTDQHSFSDHTQGSSRPAQFAKRQIRHSLTPEDELKTLAGSLLCSDCPIFPMYQRFQGYPNVET